MYALLLQDWTTLQGASNNPAVPITQTEGAWLDMSPFLDLLTFLEVKEVSASPSGSVAIAYQTSPTKDEILFQNMNDTTTGMSIGVTTGVYLRDTALCPLAQWLRWQIIPPASATWHVTFRVWIAANAPGGYARSATGYSDTAGAGGPGYVEGGPAFGPGAPADRAKIGQLPNLPHVTQHTGFKGVGYVPGVTEYSGFKGVGYVPGVKKWRPRDWRQGIERTIAPLPRSRVPFVTPDKKVTK